MEYEFIFTDVSEFAKWRKGYINYYGEEPKTRARVRNGKVEYRLFITV